MVEYDIMITKVSKQKNVIDIKQQRVKSIK